MAAYYNENDPKAAAWLRELIKRNLIAPGTVDERSIVDVRPDELAGFTQCHFFAGIGVWSYALRLAGWPDDRAVWTGSCPCQPFSAAGKGDGFADERHLWPHWFHLITHGKPEAVPVYGEQVASRDGLGWLDLVQTDMEGKGYTVRAIDSCAAGFGAPHIRQRLYWVADMPGERRDWRSTDTTGQRGRDSTQNGSVTDRMDNMQRTGLEGHGGNGDDGHQPGWDETRPHRSVAEASTIGGVEHGARHGREQWRPESDGRSAASGRGSGGLEHLHCERRNRERLHVRQGRPLEDSPQATGASEVIGLGHNQRPGPTNGFWGDADWLGCRDAKWRAVESGTFPLAHGSPARVGRLRGYGNAIVAQAAAEFIKASNSMRSI